MKKTISLISGLSLAFFLLVPPVNAQVVGDCAISLTNSDDSSFSCRTSRSSVRRFSFSQSGNFTSNHTYNVTTGNNRIVAGSDINGNGNGFGISSGNAVLSFTQTLQHNILNLFLPFP